MSTEGIVFRPAKTNANCCAKESISESDNGTEYRQPIVYFKDRQMRGGGKLNNGNFVKGRASFQDWIDLSLDYYIGANGKDIRGICYKTWRYVPKGII